MRDFTLRELDRVGLGHNTFTQPAVDFIVRFADGVLCQVGNLCVDCLFEAVRSDNQTIDIDIVNRASCTPTGRRKPISSTTDKSNQWSAIRRARPVERYSLS